jgi:Spy/CpxP family protein refolding chaperone
MRKLVLVLVVLALSAGALVAADVVKAADPTSTGVSAEQKTQIKAIVEKTIAAIKNVLTDDQQAEAKGIMQHIRAAIHARLAGGPAKNADGAKVAKGAGEGKGAGLRASLTPEQKATIKEAVKTARQEIKAILTPEQIEKIKARLQARRGAAAATAGPAS